MPYADTDFFLAIANSDDRLNSRAIKVLKDYEGEIYTSVMTLVELSLVSVRKGIPVAELRKWGKELEMGKLTPGDIEVLAEEEAYKQIEERKSRRNKGR